MNRHLEHPEDVMIAKGIEVEGYCLLKIFGMVAAVIPFDGTEEDTLDSLREQAFDLGANAIIGQTNMPLSDGPANPRLKILRGLAVTLEPEYERPPGYGHLKR